MSKRQLDQRARTFLAAQDLIRELGGLKRKAHRASDAELCRELRAFAARWGPGSDGQALLGDVFIPLRRLPARAGAPVVQIGTELPGGSHVEALAQVADAIACLVDFTPESDLAELRQDISQELGRFDPEDFRLATDGELGALGDRPAEGSKTQVRAEDSPSPSGLHLIPGGFNFHGRPYDLTGRPRAMLKALLDAPHHRLTALALRTIMGVDDEAVDVPEQVVRDTAKALRDALKKAAADAGLSIDNPLRSVGRGEDLAYILSL
jgi:hypothetical protein